MDPRYQRLAELLIGHSTSLEAGEHLLIEAFDMPEEMIIALVRTARRIGGHPHVVLRSNRLLRAINESAHEENLSVWADIDLYRMKKMHAYLGLRGSCNISEMSGVSTEQMKRIGQIYSKPVHFDQRVKHTKWCVLRWPTPSMAQLAEMSTEAFEDFYFDACTLDYARMDVACQSLRGMQYRSSSHQDQTIRSALLHQEHSLQTLRATEYSRRRVPRPRFATAWASFITIHLPSTMVTFSNVRLVFENGKIVEATADSHSIN